MTGDRDVKIFIASSHHAEAEAKALSQKLRESATRLAVAGLADQQQRIYNLDPHVWSAQTSKFRDILDTLLYETNVNDFAIILITSRINESPSDSDEIADEKHRMKFNTFYEAGLFTGALGPDKDRVFLVIDKDVVGIPSDLQGIRREEFTYGGQDLSPGKKEALLDNELTRIAENIVRTISQYTDDRVHPTRGLKLRVLTTAQLLSRELPSPGGKLATPGSVVYVNALEPIEAVDSKFSERVVQNVLNDDVSYTYVFNQNKTIFANIKKMINLFVKEIRRKSSAYAKEHNINEARRFEDSLNKFRRWIFISYQTIRHLNFASTMYTLTRRDAT